MLRRLGVQKITYREEARIRQVSVTLTCGANHKAVAIRSATLEGNFILKDGAIFGKTDSFNKAEALVPLLDQGAPVQDFIEEIPVTEVEQIRNFLTLLSKNITVK